MPNHFTPENFPDPIIIDTAATTEKMNCLGCGTLAKRLWPEHELCERCYFDEGVFARLWAKKRYG